MKTLVLMFFIGLSFIVCGYAHSFNPKKEATQKNVKMNELVNNVETVQNTPNSPRITDTLSKYKLHKMFMYTSVGMGGLMGVSSFLIPQNGVITNWPLYFGGMGNLLTSGGVFDPISRSHISDATDMYDKQKNKSNRSSLLEGQFSPGLSYDSQAGPQFMGTYRLSF